MNIVGVTGLEFQRGIARIAHNFTCAVKRLKYLIAINRINVVVNSRLIAINRTFLSILNVS
jgi:hypothetical protein